jgi:hypothetical protein
MTAMFLMFFIDLHTDFANVESLKNILMTCTRFLRHHDLSTMLRNLNLRQKAFKVFTRYWTLRSATLFPVCPPPIIILGDLQNLVFTWPLVIKTMLDMYQSELLRDPHETHPMRCIRDVGGYFIFPQWLNTFYQWWMHAPESIFQSSTIIAGKRTWWRAWPHDPISSWPLTLNERDIFEILDNNSHLQMSSINEWANASLPIDNDNTYMSHRRFTPCPRST